jgi:hypothetical protein
MRKGQLYDLILKKKPKQRIFKIDQLLKIHGHTVVRLCQYICDLSPTELAWSMVKNCVHENNVTGHVSLKWLTKLTGEGTAKE